MAKASDLRQIGVPIELDKTRHLLFNLNALCEIEDKFGSVEKGISVLSPEKGLPKMKDIRFVLYLALKHEDENLTEEKVGGFIHLKNIDKVIEGLAKAMDESTPEVDEEEEEKN